MPSYPYAAGLINPDAETGTNTGWTGINPVTLGLTSVLSGNDAAIPGSHSGTRYFVVSSNQRITWFGQTYILSSDILPDVDSGYLTASLKWWQANISADSDSVCQVIEFFDATSQWLGGRYATQADIFQSSSWLRVGSVDAFVPPLTRMVRVGGRGSRAAGTQLSAYIDDVTLDFDISSRTSSYIYTNHVGSSYSQSLSGWNTSSGTLINSAVDSFGFESGLCWSPSSFGLSTIDIPITPGQLSNMIASNSAIATLYNRQSGVGDGDIGRAGILFMTAVGGAGGVAIGSPFYTDVAQSAHSATGDDRTISAPAPNTTGAIRIILEGTRASGAQLSNYFSRIALSLTSVVGSIPPLVLSNDSTRFFPNDSQRQFPVTGQRERWRS